MSLNGFKILVADDSKSLLMILEHYLMEMGASEVIKVTDGEAAFFELKEAVDRPFDLVISDWVMPKMTGLDLLKRMRSEFDFMHIPFLMIAGDNDSAAFHQAKGIGPTDIILKPFKAESLGEKIKSILAP